MTFSLFSKKVHARFVELSKHELFVVGNDNRAFEAHYQASFPPGTNPIYKSRAEHDCSCCKNFIRNIGNVVAVVNGEVQTVWDVTGAPEPYATVAAAMAEFVRRQPITDLFRTKFPHFGAEKTRQMTDAGLKVWEHLHGDIDKKHLSPTPEAVAGAYRTNVETLRRALNELLPAAVAETLDLIDSNAIYRGAEHRHAVQAFRDTQQQYRALSLDKKEAFIWANAGSGVAHFRNTVIGTLVQDLSEGKDMEQAVRAYETKVAPTNYKRTSALITPRMVEDAMQTIRELDLAVALERRFATISDVSINNVLWADSSVKGRMKGSIEDVLMNVAKKTAAADVKAEPIGVAEFVANVLPSAVGMEVLFLNPHISNLMSLTAPVHADSGQLFKWANDFGWSYNGNITDSIKERVKAAGGNVTNAKLRISLAWYNFDDLDIHVVEPNGNHIYFGNKSGKLDVDMNAGGGQTRTPVENVSWKVLPDGLYKVIVDQWCKRESSDVGCVVEIESDGKITQLAYKKALGKQTPIATVTIKSGAVVKLEIAKDVIGGGISQKKWGIDTETFVKVNTLMLSPNYWDENQIGNKHWFFILDGCCNVDPTRGIYNEFLSSSLEKHRKVFEVLGDRTKCQPTANQLSGLGFSSTRGDTVTVKVTTSKSTRAFNVTF